jgi:argininosuccinate lyase
LVLSADAAPRGAQMTMTGRIDAAPSQAWNEEVLAPQFAYEAEYLLRHYIWIEKVLLLEYLRMGLVDAAGAAAIARRLDQVNPDDLLADPQANMSDISFALERFVCAGPTVPFAAWHADRSRNDLQACAQLMSAREQLFPLAGALIAFGQAAMSVARGAAGLPMPGYTHAQAAQIITPGFYLTALSAETLMAAERLLRTYDDLDASPLGAGSMAGQELAWDRDLMARQLGFSRAVPHALVAVASRSWAVAVASDLAGFAVTLSRFTTDLMTWGGSGYEFIDLPDDLSGISAAMPQKRNFPVLERIRGRCGLVAGAAFDLASGQRNTSYTNTVEVSKEAGGCLRTQISLLRSALRLATAVLAGLTFRPDRMRDACAREYLGGFTLANMLTLRCGMPWRAAQVTAGRYVRRALDAGLPPARADGALLEAAAAEAGYEVPGSGELLATAFSVEEGMRAKRSPGSAHPDSVTGLLAAQEAGFDAVGQRWSHAGRAVTAAADGVGALFTVSASCAPEAVRAP